VCADEIGSIQMSRPKLIAQGYLRTE